MITLTIKQNDDKRYLYIFDSYNDDRYTPKYIWELIKNQIKILWECNSLTLKKLTSTLQSLNDFSDKSSGEDSIFDQTYLCTLTLTDDYVYFIVEIPDTFDYNDDRPDNMTPLKEIYYLKDEFKGNCVDDFIKRGLESRLTIINDLIDDTKKRADIRTNVVEYHQTGCYEKDFANISLIKYQVQKMLDNCNKQLEALADKYTKL